MILEIYEIYEILDKIRNSKGGEKKKLLTSPALEEILRLTYDPFIRFGLSSSRLAVIKGCGDNSFDHSTIDFLEKLSRGEKNHKQSYFYLVSLNKKSCELAKLILAKNLNLGVGVKTINSIIPGLLKENEDGLKRIPTMLCTTFDWEKANYPLIAAVKKDGVRGLTHKKVLYTRAGKKISISDEILAEINGYLFEKDGELTVINKGFDEASGDIRSDNKSDIIYWVFDCPEIIGKKTDRLNFLDSVIVESDHLKVVPWWIIKSEDELRNKYKQVIDEGEEGLVIYTIDHQYRDCRSKDWCRLVPKKTIDLKVVGFEEGKGKMIGTLGKLICRMNKDNTVKIGTGFTVKEWKDLSEKDKANYSSESQYNSRNRKYIWENKEYFRFKIAESEFKEFTLKGSLRQPRFKKWRTDKIETDR